MALPTIGATVHTTGTSPLTQSGFVVSTTGQVLVVAVAHEGTGTDTITGVTYGGVALTLVRASEVTTSSTRDHMSLWMLANPSVGTANIVVTANHSSPIAFRSMLVDGVDLSNGLASAVNVTAGITGSSQTTISTTINPTLANCLIIDAVNVSLNTYVLTANNGQTIFAADQEANATNFSWALGKIDSGASGSRTLGYTSSASAGRLAYVAVALAPGSGLGILTLTGATGGTITPGAAWSATIVGKTSGSTISATCDDGTVMSVSGTTLTALGSGSGTGFLTSGTRTITLTETLAGASNSPRTSPGLTVVVSVLSALPDLSLTSVPANRVPFEAWAATIVGATAGSTITASCDDGTVMSVSGTTLTATGNGGGSGFKTAGSRTITLTETLAGATNSPHVSPAINYTVLNQVKVLVLGSSTPDHWLDTSVSTTETPNARLYAAKSGAWQPIATYIGSPSVGAGGIAFGNYLLNKLGPSYRVDLLDFGFGGSWLSDWAARSTVDWSIMQAAVASVGGVHCAVCHVGANDARGEAVTSRASHETLYRQLIANLRSDISASALPFFIMGCARGPLEPGTSDIYWARARAAEMNVAQDANVYLASTVVDLPMHSDNIHLSVGEAGGNAVSARRAAQAVHTILYGGTQEYLGPRIGSPSYDSATGWVLMPFTVRTGAALVGRTSQANLTGFVFKAAGAPVTPLTEPFVSGPTQVAALLATGLSSVTVEYQEGHDPTISNDLWDNGSGVPKP